MKKLFSLFVGAYMLTAVFTSAYADCVTGFACSIDDLDKKQSEMQKQFSQNINSYFDKSVNEELFFSSLTDSNISYNDLFVFNTIV